MLFAALCALPCFVTSCALLIVTLCTLPRFAPCRTLLIATLCTLLRFAPCRSLLIAALCLLPRFAHHRTLLIAVLCLLLRSAPCRTPRLTTLCALPRFALDAICNAPKYTMRAPRLAIRSGVSHARATGCAPRGTRPASRRIRAGTLAQNTNCRDNRTCRLCRLSGSRSTAAVPWRA